MAQQTAVNSQVTDFVRRGKGKVLEERSRDRKPMPGLPQPRATGAQNKTAKSERSKTSG